MTALHHVRVRRARGLPMPLPPKPKRPLGPPALFTWKGVPIRVRADIERAGWTWDGFLDELVAFRAHPSTFGEGWFALTRVERLVPPADLDAHREDVWRRIAEHRVATAMAALRELGKPQREGRGSFMGRFFGRHA
ncbi:hypothetical protein [Methylobacterium sp. ID0610]|uniref:hypothetical protein n=1 Tax=Methylobacterium carpenticola TaxID=3344827 RepID=UPI00367BCB21